MLFVLVAFISCAAFATAAGTGLGTTIAGISILYPAGCLLGANPLVLAGAIIGGGAFGDNLAPVSDTTICSALTQGADITGVVKSRLRYSAVAAAITILFILFFGGGGSVTGEALPHDLIAEYMNPKGLLMLIPAILTIYLAIKKGDVIYACIAGTAAVIVVALPTGLLTLSDIICLSDGGVSGTLVDGIGGMADIVILCLLVMGMVGVMKAGEGDKLLIDIATKVIRGVCGAELSIVILSAILAGMTGINTPAILAIGVPYAKPMGERFHIHPYRRANLLDASSCSLAYTLPWTSIALATATYSAQGNALFGDVVPAIGAEEIFFYPVYAWALLAIMLFASITGWGRRFAGPRGRTPAGTTRPPCCSSRHRESACPGWTCRSRMYPGSRRRSGYPPGPGPSSRRCIPRPHSGQASAPGAECVPIVYPRYVLLYTRSLRPRKDQSPSMMNRLSSIRAAPI